MTTPDPNNPDRPQFQYTLGNKKIGTDTLIFNMGPASTCPAGLAGNCPLFTSGKCYAMKAERLYPQSLPFRQNQSLYWRATPAQVIIADIRRALSRHSGIRWIRVNESGDFYSQNCVEKLSAIADGIRDLVQGVYTYTHQPLNYAHLSSALTINGSGFMVHNNFKTIDRHATPAGRVICPGDCRTCNICKRRRGVTIEINEH